VGGCRRSTGGSNAKAADGWGGEVAANDVGDEKNTESRVWEKEKRKRTEPKVTSGAVTGELEFRKNPDNSGKNGPARD